MCDAERMHCCHVHYRSNSASQQPIGATQSFKKNFTDDGRGRDSESETVHGLPCLMEGSVPPTCCSQFGVRSSFHQ